MFSPPPHFPRNNLYIYANPWISEVSGVWWGLGLCLIAKETEQGVTITLFSHWSLSHCSLAPFSCVDTNTILFLNYPDGETAFYCSLYTCFKQVLLVKDVLLKSTADKSDTRPSKIAFWISQMLFKRTVQGTEHSKYKVYIFHNMNGPS